MASTKQKARDVSLEVRQYGRIVPAGVRTPSCGSSKTGQENRRPRDNKHEASFDSLLSGKELVKRAEAKSKPVVRRAASRANNLHPGHGVVGKDSGACNRSVSDSRAAIKAVADFGHQGNIGDLIEKARKELEEINPQNTSSGTMPLPEPVAEDSLAAVIDSVRRSRGQGAAPETLPMGDKELRQESAKWREFGYLLTESYDQLKQRHAAAVAETQRSQQIVFALKEQVEKLKALLKHSSTENRCLREKLDSIEKGEITDCGEMKQKYERAVEETRMMKKERDALAKSLAGKQQENEILENEKLLNNKLVQQLNDKIKVPS